MGKRLAQRLKLSYNVTISGRNNKQNMLASQFSGCEVMPMDVASMNSVRDAVIRIKPDIIIHAAATKFVDLAEKQPLECIDVNVIGSQNVARIAMEQNVKKVIGISTDKASPPVRNIYGLSKATMERLFCGLNEHATTQFTCVRYGNVAWSTGSVLPIWKKMLEKTGVIGTTGPEMRRFFFTVDQAVELVCTALENMELVKGKVLSRVMKAAQIKDILRVLTETKGGTYELIDGRPGERIDEYLIGDLELPYTEELMLKNIKHYLISFNEKVAKPITVGLSSANTEKLTDGEISDLLCNIPEEEL